MSNHLEYDVPEDPGEGSGKTPDLPTVVPVEADPAQRAEEDDGSDGPDSINVDEPGEGTETGGV